MRRLILLALVAILCFFSYKCVAEGVVNDSFNIDIKRYEQVQEESDSMKKSLKEYNDKNTKTFEVSLNSLYGAKKEYDDAKKDYQDLIDSLGIQDNSSEEENFVDSTKTAYQIDFLLATIGNYATKEGVVDLNLQFRESAKKASENAGYVFLDLYFTVSADYILIANFIYDLEDDDRLAYEINDFYMTKDKATFTVYEIPVEKSTLTTVSVPESKNESQASNTTNNTTTKQGTTSKTNTTNTVN